MIDMSHRYEQPLTFRPLYDGQLVSVCAYCCRACRSGPAAEEDSGSNDIVLMRRARVLQTLRSALHNGRR